MKLKTHIKLSKLIKKLERKVYSNYLWEIKSILDSDYHNEITEEQYRELGHIYYGGDSINARKRKLTNGNLGLAT